MDPNELFDYVTEGMKWLAIGGGSYLGVLVGLNEIPDLFSRKIKSQEELERITKEEMEKLGMTRSVSSKFLQKYLARASRLDDGAYQIELGGNLATRKGVRHELYHIHRGHADSRREQQNVLLIFLDYLFRQEPQAISYGLFKIKI